MYNIKSVHVEDEGGEVEEVEPKDERKGCEKKKGERQKSKTVFPSCWYSLHLQYKYKRSSLHAKTFVPLFNHW